MTPRLNLIVIRVSDLAMSRQFYESLGLEFREEKHGIGPIHLACQMGGMVFEIYPAAVEDLTTGHAAWFSGI